MKKQLNIKKLILLNLPYILMGLFSTNFGEAWRMAVGADASAKMLSFFSTLPVALASWWPSLHPLDLLVGLCCCGGLRLAVYLKSKNAKKYRHGMEYGSARWGTHEDITPYIDPVFQNNVILTKTESLTMNSRPKDPKTARNKNVLVIGGSGSGKTRFWLKPNLMQMHSSYVVTDPKGTILVECGKMLQRGAPKLGKDGKPMKDKHGKVIYEPYRIKVLNTINFKKSMHYKQSVSTRDAAAFYGIEVKRNGMACCPFHDDKNPSMKVDQRFHCFGCGEDGDVIDFTAKLFDLSPKEAAEKLAQDFGLIYDSQAPPRRRYVRQKTEAQKFREDRQRCYRVLSDYYYLLKKWEADNSPRTLEEEPHPRFVEAIQKKPYVEYLLDLFLYESEEEQKAWIAEHTDFRSFHFR